MIWNRKSQTPMESVLKFRQGHWKYEKVRHIQKTPQKCYAPQKLDTFGGAYFYGKKGSKTEKV